VHAWQKSDDCIFRGTEEDIAKKKRKDLFVKMKKTERKKIHFQTARITPFSDRR